MKRKTLLSVVLSLALLLSMLPMTVSAETFTVSLEGPRVDGARAKTAVASPTLADGNYASYLDRVASAPAYVREYYNWLVANANANGVLADPTKASNYNGEYYHSVVKIEGSATFPFTNQEEAVATGTALAQDALAKEFDSFTQWAGVAWDAFDREHPEVFWLSGQTSYSYLGGLSFSLKNNIVTVSYEADMVVWLQYENYDVRDYHYRSLNEVSAGIAIRDKAVQEILAGCPKGSVYDQVVYLNDALTARNAYNSSVATGNSVYASSLAWKCISALEGNVGNSGPVCEGYARAFQVLCDQLKIPCVLVNGPAVDALNDTPESHMWNYVQVDGGWYAVDVTWNDPYVSYAADKKVTGSECRRWMLLGSDSQVATGLTFLQSHVVLNRVRDRGLSFTNGPVLERNAYDPNATSGFSISGKVTSANADNLTVELWQGNTLVATTTVSGKTGTYTFDKVAPGSYRLTFTKADHVTFEQSLTVAEDTAVQDLKVLLLGDVSGDGRINVGDVAKLYGHIKKTAVITDSYVLLCMDMTGDGRLNVGDTARLYGKVRAK